MNVFCFLGKLDHIPVLQNSKSGIHTTTIILNVSRPFTNPRGIYETDSIPIEVWRGLAETICNVAKKGDWLSVKGRVCVKTNTKDEKTYYNPVFIAENIEFVGP